MTGHKDLLSAVKAGDVQIVEMSRREARMIEGFEGGTDEVNEAFETALDQAQGEADEEGLATYVVLKINGGPL